MDWLSFVCGYIVCHIVVFAGQLVIRKQKKGGHYKNKMISLDLNKEKSNSGEKGEFL